MVGIDASSITTNVVNLLAEREAEYEQHESVGLVRLIRISIALKLSVPIADIAHPLPTSVRSFNDPLSQRYAEPLVSRCGQMVYRVS